MTAEHSMTSEVRAAGGWPARYSLFGIGVSDVTCAAAADAVMQAAHERVPAVVSAFSVHALIEASSNDQLARKCNRFAIILPDGQPVRWALHWLCGRKVKNTVQGYELMTHLCQRAAAEGVSIYLYGSTPSTLAALEARLLADHPGLIIVGSESPPFRQLSPEEDAEMVERVNASGAGLIFLGLGCPKQDHFAGDHADQIAAVQFCVGAAFDFLAGTIPPAPLWMQRNGLAWFYRLCKEPRRLWKRYLVTNTVFLTRLTREWLTRRLLFRPLPSPVEQTI